MTITTAKKKTLTLNQRESRLKELLEDAEGFNFDKSVIRVYTAQLKEVQAEIKSIKESNNKIYTDGRKSKK